MNFRQNHTLCICFGRKPEHEQAFIFFRQNFLTPLPCSSPLLGRVLQVFFLHHLFQSRFLDLAGQEPLCGGQIRARQRVILVQSISQTHALRPPAERGLSSDRAVEALSISALLGGKRTQAGLPGWWPSPSRTVQ